MAQTQTKRKGRALISKAEVDVQANAAFAAFTTCLGRPFQAGKRNVRGICLTWDPLAHGPNVDVDPFAFAQSYLPAHFFDRYFYADELGVQKELKQEALEKFKVNLLRGWMFNVELDVDKKLDEWLSSVFGEAALLAQRILGPLDEADVFGEAGHGPNAAVDIPRKHSYLGVKTRVLHGSRECVETFIHEYLRWDNTLAGMLVDAETREGISIAHTPGNMLSFVPKKFDKLRTMLIEPPLNMFFQLGLGRVAAKRLLHNANIDLQTQADVHRRLVVLASRHPELNMATLDWSEASDRQWISIWRRVLPPDWFWWAMHIRSEVAIYKGEEYPLPMMGTMGNGFTFPLQTLLFLVLLRGIARTEGIPELGISVFGDDCIVPCDLVPHVQRFADLVGWALNADKSYWEGDFRESCGTDAYRGMVVRPFMIERPAGTKRKQQLLAWAYVVFNNMDRVLPDTCPRFHIVRWLEEFVQAYDLGRIHLVPPRFSDASGVRVSSTRAFSGFDPDKYYVPHMDKYGNGWFFRHLASKPRRTADWVKAHYWLRLKNGNYEFDEAIPGKPNLDYMERDACPGLDSAGTVPIKMTRYQSARAYAHSWVYVTDSAAGLTAYPLDPNN